MPRKPAGTTTRSVPRNTKNRDANRGLRKPGKLDFEKADQLLEKVVRENQQWLKEMAEK